MISKSTTLNELTMNSKSIKEYSINEFSISSKLEKIFLAEKLPSHSIWPYMYSEHIYMLSFSQYGLINDTIPTSNFWNIEFCLLIDFFESRHIDFLKPLLHA